MSHWPQKLRLLCYDFGEEEVQHGWSRGLLHCMMVAAALALRAATASSIHRLTWTQGFLTPDLETTIAIYLQTLIKVIFLESTS